MKDKNKKNVLNLNTFLLLLAAAILITTVTENAVAKSLYVIADINRRPTPVQAYDIGADGTLAFQTQHDIPRHMVGAVGIAIDSDSGYLFVTYEASDVIQLVDATTMEAAGTTVAPDAKELAGIVYDHKKGLLYCVNRGTDMLYVYDWEPKTATLIHAPSSPVTLKGTITAYGIALDDIDDLLYVADRNKTIKVYSTNDWSLVDTISVSRFAISIAVDVMNGYLYTGGGYVYNNYLTQYHLATGTEKEVQVEPDAGVIGLGVDTETGLVYVSTGIDNQPGGDNIRVYDTSLNQIDFVPAIGNPTGLVIPGKDIGYNPLNLKKIVVRGAVGKTATGKIQCVGAGQTITYGICFDNIDNDYTVTDVFIVDTLPDEVSFVTADDDGIGGQYDPKTHTYKWYYSSFPPGSSTCLELTVLVNEDVKVGTTITNFVTINSNQTPPSTTRLDVVTTYASLNLKKSILGCADDQVKWVDVNDLIIYSIYFDNNDNDFNVTDVSIVDILPDEVSFLTADDIIHGQYNPLTHTYTWSYPSMPAGSANYLELVVQVNQDTNPCTIITNSVIIDSNETPPNTASVDAITYYNPINLSKSIIGDADGEVKWTDVNETITYSICFDNNDNDYTVTNVSIVDTLPDEVNFVSADGDGVFGQYDPNAHTFEWSYESLGPGEDVCLELEVKVNQDAAPGATITNKVIADSNETLPSEEASVDATVKYDPLNVSKSIVGAVEGQVTWVDVNETITYSICIDNKDNEGAATNVSIVDTLPPEVDFVKADGNVVFDPNKPRTVKWVYESLGPGEDVCLELVVQVNQGAAPGVTITNKVIAESNETPQSKEASVDATVKYDPLNVSKSIVGAAEGQVKQVDRGETIFYSIRVDNNNKGGATNVFIVDKLPQQVSLVWAEDDGVSGQYDPDAREYTWSGLSLEAGQVKRLELEVKVNQDATPGSTITNKVIADSNETPESEEASVDATIKKYNQLNLSKIVIGAVEGQVKRVDRGETIFYRIRVDNKDNDCAVTDVSIVDTLPKEVSFVSAEKNGTFGQYDSVARKYTWSYPSLQPGEAISLRLTVKVKQDAPWNKTFSNSVAVKSNQTQRLTKSVNVKTLEPPLKIDLLILPKMIRRSSKLNDIQALATLPKGIGKNDIENVPPTLVPVLYPNKNIKAKRHVLTGTANQGKVLAVFDRAQLLNAVPGYGRFTLRLQGRLKSRRAFYGEAVIQISRFTGS